MDNYRKPIIPAVLNKKVRSLRPGDIVLLPDNSYETLTNGIQKATVQRIYPHIVSLKTIPDGRMISLSYVDAVQLQVIRPAKFEIKSKEMDENAIGQTLDTVRREEKN